MRRFLRGLVALIGISAVVTAIAALFSPVILPMVFPQSAQEDGTGRLPTVDGAAYPGDPEAEAALVEGEDARIVEVRSAAASAQGAGVEPGTPFRALTEPVATIVLPARTEPYTLPELAELVPDSVIAGQDGTYGVHDSLAVMTGATVELDAGETLRLASSAHGFASLTTLGGSLDIQGSEDAHATITSWDGSANAADDSTSDGRAYVRVEEGAATISWADFGDLGFWSGPTGGLALIGSDIADVDVTAGPEDSGDVPSVALEEAADTAAVTAKLDHVGVVGNAFGIFVAEAQDVTIADSKITGSLVDGIVFARGVTASRVTDSEVTGNGHDGVVVARAGTDLSFENLKVTANGRNGLTLDGTAMATGPNATGAPVEIASGRVVKGGTFSQNARYGIEVRGGTDVALSDVSVSGGQMGIVVGERAGGVTISGAAVDGAQRHGISIRDRSADVGVSHSSVSGSDVGIYVRSSQVDISDNAISGSREHGMTLVGSMHGSRVFGNSISGSGSGTTAIDWSRGLGVRVEDNLVDGWIASRSLQQIVASVLQPLTILWGAVLAAVALAVFWRLGRGPRGVPDPQRAPLQSMSRGVFDRAEAIRVRS